MCVEIEYSQSRQFKDETPVGVATSLPFLPNAHRPCRLVRKVVPQARYARAPYRPLVFGPAPYGRKLRSGPAFHFAQPNQQRPAPTRGGLLSNMTTEEN